MSVQLFVVYDLFSGQYWHLGTGLTSDPSKADVYTPRKLKEVFTFETKGYIRFVPLFNGEKVIALSRKNFRATKRRQHDVSEKSTINLRRGVFTH